MRTPNTIDSADTQVTNLAQAVGLSDALDNGQRHLLQQVLAQHDDSVEEAATWLKANNEALQGSAPAALIKQGQSSAVTRMLAVLNEVYGPLDRKE